MILTVVITNDVYINWMDCTMLKNRANARFQDHLFCLFFPTLALFLAPNHDSSPITIIIQAIIPSPVTTFSATAHVRIFQNGGKLASLFEITCHCSSPSSLYYTSLEATESPGKGVKDTVRKTWNRICLQVQEAYGNRKLKYV